MKKIFKNLKKNIYISFLNSEKKQIYYILRKSFKNESLKIKEIKKSKTGNRSYFAHGDKLKVKVYTCWNKNYAINVKRISDILIEGGINLPKILHTENNYVFSEWIEGDGIENLDFKNDSNFLEKIVKYQASLHKFKISQKISAYHYTDFLINRLVRYGVNYIDPLILKSIKNILKNKEKKFATGIMHPDFTSRNLIVDKNKNIYLIDNETLHYGTGKEFDILVTADNFFSEDSNWLEKYIDIYSKYDDIGTLVSERKFWDMVWMIKVAGSNFQKNDIKKARDIIDAIKNKI